ncbi:MAG TPA: YciI family protein [Planctomycetota bacterium]|nr:YciI family protein [Planctomycetota bacterium]
MKFMLMMQGTQSGWESMGSWAPAEIQAHIGFMLKLVQELTGSGELVLAEGLDVPANARIVRAQKANAPLVTDGPFPEAKEFLAGFWIVECSSVDRVIEIAAKASTAPGPGGAPLGIPIEVRQVMNHPSLEG